VIRHFPRQLGDDEIRSALREIHGPVANIHRLSERRRRVIRN
jgi:hypothetical protein